MFSVLGAVFNIVFFVLGSVCRFGRRRLKMAAFKMAALMNLTYLRPRRSHRNGQYHSGFLRMSRIQPRGNLRCSYTSEMSPGQRKILVPPSPLFPLGCTINTLTTGDPANLSQYGHPYVYKHLLFTGNTNKQSNHSNNLHRRRNHQIKVNFDMLH